MERCSENVAKMRITYERSRDWQFWMLLSADRHIDHVHSDIKMQKRHLDQAAAGGWPVVDIGDLYCAMQGKWDKRRTRGALLDRLNETEQYADVLVDYAHEFAGPYAANWALMGLGNHETSVLRNNETHLLQRLVKRLQTDGSPVVMGGYQGWLKLLFTTQSNSGRTCVNVRYTHGSGGSAPVTKGTIQTSRRAVCLPDANIVISGHTHEQWMLPISRFRLASSGREYRDEQVHLQIPSYKDEVVGQAAGWAVEKGFAPKPTGAYWLRFWWDNNTAQIKYDANRAM